MLAPTSLKSRSVVPDSTIPTNITEIKAYPLSISRNLLTVSLSNSNVLHSVGIISNNERICLSGTVYATVYLAHTDLKIFQFRTIKHETLSIILFQMF